jgi:hypothetical protein
MSTSTRSRDRTDLPGELGADYAAEDEHRPLAGYAVLTSVFGTAMAGGLLAARSTGRPLPPRFETRDVVMAGIATHKLSRLVTKDKVTGFARAPFTRFQGKAGHGEVKEAARGRGLRYAIGELLVCPYCIAQWVAGGIAAGWVLAPRTTRLLSAMWAVQGIADGVQLAYSAGKQQT